jgi:hypothetical protein
MSEHKREPFLIAPSSVKNSRVEGYEIHITGTFDDAAMKYLYNIAFEKHLAITQHSGSVLLYKSKPSFL